MKMTAKSKSISQQGGTTDNTSLSTSLGKVPADFEEAGAVKGNDKRKTITTTTTTANAQSIKQSNIGKSIEGKTATASGSSTPKKLSSTLANTFHSSSSLSIFAHLPEYERQSTQCLTRKTKEADIIYPQVMTAAIEMAEGRVSGSTERCVSMLECFKQVILQSYTASSDQAISRHMESFLRPQISYLVSARPLSVSMSHAIRHLKLVISQLPPDIGEEDAKQMVAKCIDSFVRNRIDIAGKIIVESAMSKIAMEGEVILTYGQSSLVRRLLLSAHSKHFRCIVVVGNNDCEGQQLVKDLVKQGIECTIVPISSIGFVLREATKVIIGAHCIFSNGSLLGQVGTAVVGLLAHQHNVPVMVLAETLKFTERVQLDAFVYNELADPQPMIEAAKKYGQVKVRACNLVYDVMPAEYITIVVSEVGMIPVTSVPVVLREHPY